MKACFRVSLWLPKGKNGIRMKPVFLPMDGMGRPTAEGKEGVPSEANRREFKRHRYTQALEIQLDKPGSRYNQYEAMSLEISLGWNVGGDASCFVYGGTGGVVSRDGVTCEGYCEAQKRSHVRIRVCGSG
jgi:hypothetical protein